MLTLNSFNAEEQKELELFAEQYMNDTNSATNGDSLRMALSLHGIENSDINDYKKNFTSVDNIITSIYKNISSILDR